MDTTEAPERAPGEDDRENEVIVLMKRAADPEDPYTGEDIDGEDPEESEDD